MTSSDRSRWSVLGYDPNGALYKAVGNLVPNFSSTGVFQKLEPDDDPTRTDYLELANGINESSSAAVRRRTVFDLLDLPPSHQPPSPGRVGAPRMTTSGPT
jgi:hypothetical protein